MRIILVNGAPGVGKDTVANYLSNIQPRRCVFVHKKFAAPIKDAIHGTFGKFHEHEKDKEVYWLKNMTPRQLYIAFSEEFLKPIFGDTIFGKLAVRELMDARKFDKELQDRLVVVFSDCGFESEIRPVISYIGSDNVLLLRLHREGHTFDGDSRSYVELDKIDTFDVYNDGTVEELQTKVKGIVEKWLEE